MPIIPSGRNNYSIDSATQIPFSGDNTTDKMVFQTEGVATVNGVKGLVITELDVPAQGVKVTAGWYALSFGTEKMVTGQFDIDKNLNDEFQTVAQVQATTADNFSSQLTPYISIPDGTKILICIRYNLTDNINVKPVLVGVIGTVGTDPDITDNVDGNEIYYLPIARITKSGSDILNAQIEQTGNTDAPTNEPIYPDTVGGNSGGTQDAVQLSIVSGVVDWDLSQSNWFYLTLAEDVRLNNPTNVPIDLAKQNDIRLVVTQDSVGGHDFTEWGQTIVPTEGVNNMLWQSGIMVRFTIDAGNLSNVNIGDFVNITGAINGNNNGVYEITNTDNSTFIEILNPNRTDATDDELNSPATYRVFRSVFIPEQNGVTNINMADLTPGSKTYFQLATRGDGKLDVFTNKLGGFTEENQSTNQKNILN